MGCIKESQPRSQEDLNTSCEVASPFCDPSRCPAVQQEHMHFLIRVLHHLKLALKKKTTTTCNYARCVISAIKNTLLNNKYPDWAHPQSTPAVSHSLNPGSRSWQQQSSQLRGKSSLNVCRIDTSHPQQPLRPLVRHPFQRAALFMMATGLGG